jgi:hypothetical protein
MVYSLLAVIPQPALSPSSGPTVEDEATSDVPEVVPVAGGTPVPEPSPISDFEPLYPPMAAEDENETAPVVVPPVMDIPASEPASALAVAPAAPVSAEKDDARGAPTDDADAAPVSTENETGLAGVAVINLSEGKGKGGATAIPSLTTSQSADVFNDPQKDIHMFKTVSPAAPATPLKATAIDRGYHPAELHPRSASYSSVSFSPTATTLHSNNTSPSPSMKEKGHSYFRKRTDSSHSTASQESGSMRGRKKVGLFDKVRGEAKVIVGRLERKKEKVEEGKRILHGED